MSGATNRSMVKRRNRNEDQRDQPLDEITVLTIHKPHTPRAQSKEPASWEKTLCPSVFPFFLPSCSPPSANSYRDTRGWSGSLPLTAGSHKCMTTELPVN